MLKRFKMYLAKIYINRYEYSIFIFFICSHWKCIRTKKLSINWRPNKNVLCSHSNSKLCLSKSLRLSPSRLIIKTTTYVKEKKTEKFQQKQITEKNEEKKKEIRNRKNYILLSVSCTIWIKCTGVPTLASVVEFV